LLVLGVVTVGALAYARHVKKIWNFEKDKKINYLKVW